MMKLLIAFKTLFSVIFKDRNQTLEQYIISNNPQNNVQVEALEREFYAKIRMRSLV
jgi:hypothetical protein